MMKVSFYSAIQTRQNVIENLVWNISDSQCILPLFCIRLYCTVFVKLLSGSKSGSNSTKESDAGGSLDSNRSHLSSNSKKSSLTRARNAAAKKEAKDKKESANKESKELDEYDQIERQLLADQEKELEYLNGLDQPINKADLPLLCPDENHNGPPMNEPMKLRYANKQLRFVIKTSL